MPLPGILHPDQRRFLLLGLMFALFVFITSVNAPPTEDTMDHISFWGPFQRISDHNRLICSCLAVGLISLCLAWRPPTESVHLPLLAGVLLGLHILIFLKNLSAIGLSAFLLLLGAILLIATTWLAAKALTVGNIPSWWPLVLASLVFLAANLIQYRINPAATMQVSGRFHGITSNPQMYALTTAIMVPSLLYQYAHDRRKLNRLMVLLAFLFLLFFAVCSGSRLSVLLSAFSVLMYYRARVAQLASFVIPVVVIAICWLKFGEATPLDPHSHIASLENTRSEVWKIQIRALVDYPLFGRPLLPGERAGFGENSYLASGAVLGLPGLLLASLLGFVIVRKILALIQAERRLGWCPELALPVAVLSSCLLGGFFEAFLLGIFTFPLASLLFTIFASEEMLSRMASPSLIIAPNVPQQDSRKELFPIRPVHFSGSFLMKRRQTTFLMRPRKQR